MNFSKLVTILSVFVCTVPYGISGKLSVAEAKNVSQVRSRVARVHVDYVDVRMGAATAYESKGRIYGGDIVTVRGQSGKPWIEVISGSVQGWIPLSAVVLLAPEDVAKTDGKVDPGLDKRLKNYTYDNDGRRRTEGKFTGSGEGTKSVSDRSSTILLWDKIRVGLGVGFGQIHRRFESNAPEQSFLRQVELKPAGLASAFTTVVDFDGNWRLDVWAEDIHFAQTAIVLPIDGLPSRGQLSANSQLVGFCGNYVYDVGPARISVGLGTEFNRASFRELQPTPIALTAQTLALLGQVGAGLRHGRIEIDVHTYLGYPISHEQTPVSSGENQTSILGLRLQSSYWLSNGWGLAVRAGLNKRRSDYQGANQHVDLLNSDTEPLTYTAARETDYILSTTLGVVYEFQ